MNKSFKLSNDQGGESKGIFFSRSIAILRHKTERNLGMMLQNTLFSVFLTMLYNE